MTRDAFKRTTVSVGLLGVFLLTAGDDKAASPAHLCQKPRVYRVRIAIVGMDPFSLEVPVGARVTFTNDDRNFAHQIVSDCSEFDVVGRLDPGESGATSPFEESKACKYHDSLQPENPLRSGKVVIQ